MTEPMVKVQALEYIPSTECTVAIGITADKKKEVFNVKLNPFYFFILRSDYELLSSDYDGSEYDYARKMLAEVAVEVDASPGAYVYALGGECVKICFKSREDMTEAAKAFEEVGINVLEYLHPSTRLRLEAKIEVPHYRKMKLAALDIEVDARSGMPDPKKADQRITMIAIASADETLYISDFDEALMFSKLSEALSKYSIIITWNGSRFDIPYLEQRARVLGVRFSLQDVVHIDALALYRRTTYARGQSCRLDDVAKRELGMDIKKEFDGINRGASMWDAFLHDKAKLAKYCMADAYATFRLATTSTLKLLDPCYYLVKISYLEYEDYVYISRVVDSMVLQHSSCQSPRIVFPSKPKEEKQPYEGAYVFDPKPGLWSNVLLMDFASMYNRIMQTWNIGIDTVKLDKSEWSDDDIVSPLGVHFSSKRESVLRYALRSLEEKRNEWKKKLKAATTEDEARLCDSMQSAYKVAILSMYGVIGDAYSRYYCHDVVASVTAFGQACIKEASAAVQQVINDSVVIYGDTDSLFVAVEGYPGQIVGKINGWMEALNAELKRRLTSRFKCYDEYRMELSFVCLFSRFYIRTKKRYIGRVVWKDDKIVDEYVVRGFEIAKFSAFDLYKEFQSECFKILLESVDTSTAFKRLMRYVDDVVKEVYAGKRDKELILRAGVHNDVNEYDSRQPYIEAARKLEKMGMFRRDDVVKYVITSVKNGSITGVEPVVNEVPKITVSGYNYYVNVLREFVRDLTEFGGLAYVKFNEDGAWQCRSA